ncbi:RNA-binding protein 42-like isoform X2 [Corticium candelabrum]|uniref:RNA-binding protein 42-like isoform X2 n=1 Tax=Corticium candelabrum TaxID=121492 RepID=UPI002E25C15E|nr:RNA-binding protein 42-like isoform X2 [Corticium candelabrum]
MANLYAYGSRSDRLQEEFSRFEEEIGSSYGRQPAGMPMARPPGLPPALPVMPMTVVGASGVAHSMHASIPANAITDEEQRQWQANYSEGVEKQKKKNKKALRSSGGQVWSDPSLLEWDINDFRLFCGDLGNEVNDEGLARAFSHYPSFQKARVIRDKRTRKTRGYGFVSFKDGHDYLKAMKEMDGKYIGNRPVKLRKSTWKDRNIDIVRKRMKEKKKLGYKV